MSRRVNKRSGMGGAEAKKMVQKENPAPFSDLLREFFSEQPSNVDGQFSTSTLYYRDWLFRKVFSIFEFEGFKPEWEMDYYIEHQFLDGEICVCDTTLGVLPLQTGHAGINVFNHPTTCVIANPILGSFEKTIDKDCILIKLQYNFKGINDILDRYATLLAMCDSSISVNLMNSKVAFIGFADTPQLIKTLQKLYDKLSAGFPAVFAKRSDKVEFFFNHVKENFVAKDIQDVKRMIVNEFLTEIGVPTANVNKRERLNADEVHISDAECTSNIWHWYKNLKEGWEKASAMFEDVNVTVKIHEYKDESGNVTVGEDGDVDEDEDEDGNDSGGDSDGNT